MSRTLISVIHSLKCGQTNTDDDYVHACIYIYTVIDLCERKEGSLNYLRDEDKCSAFTRPVKKTVFPHPGFFTRVGQVIARGKKLFLSAEKPANKSTQTSVSNAFVRAIKRPAGRRITLSLYFLSPSFDFCRGSRGKLNENLGHGCGISDERRANAHSFRLPKGYVGNYYRKPVGVHYKQKFNERGFDVIEPFSKNLGA